jgi:hypothetical protein
MTDPTTPAPLTAGQTIGFLLSVIASGERLSEAEVAVARAAARSDRPGVGEGLRKAAEAAYNVLATLDRQALNPGPDHLVAVSVEAWGDGIRPVLALLRVALRAAPEETE